MSHQNVTIGQQHGIADLAASLRVLPLPRHLAVLDDEHTLLLTLTSIEERVDFGMHRNRCHHCQQHRTRSFQHCLYLIHFSYID